MKQEPAFVLAGEAESVAEAWSLIERERPDVAVLDVEMNGERSIAIAPRVRDEALPVRLLFLTMHRDETIFNEAIDAGAAGYVLKDVAAREIVAAIRAVAAGESYVSPAISYRTVENHRANICAKLGLTGTNALLRFALEHRSSL